MTGKFYVVATPIGNLEDITLRAVRILGEVDFIFCEDTREGRKLLCRFNISKPLDSYHSKSKDYKTDKIISLLSEGKNVALISDAGTPAISDPGSILVRDLRERLPEVEIAAVPGPSALTAALSIAGMPVNVFTFYGFLPHKKGRETLFRLIAEDDKAAVFYESPHRIMKTFQSLFEHCPERQVAVARELTKVYEELVRGTPKEILDRFERAPDKIRGEFVIIVSAK
ncbi:MAG: 16S rRNA (cytidine(1402)-2'-O)-methyltransferase [Candidatus Taylorbacteria bacterium]|nr:16S rRNA (cytidine(1402)-2'-O)-methyltransferase [Candidatus Taylorbacteria bacterium]